MKKIIAGSTLSARSICDHDCIFTLEVLSRTERTAVVKYLGKTRRTKIHNFNGEEMIRPDNYSMAPTFRPA